MEKPEPTPRTWRVDLADEEGVRIVAAARIVVTDAAALLFLDANLELVYALAPESWRTVERVCELEEEAGAAALD